MTTQTDRGSPSAPAARPSFRWRRKLTPYLFLSPFFLFFLLFWVYPIGYSFVLSFINTRVRPWTFQPGFNWGRLVQDSFFWEALGNTMLILVVQVPIMLALATALAVAFSSDLLRAKGLFRFAFFAPLVLGAVRALLGRLPSDLQQRSGRAQLRALADRHPLDRLAVQLDARDGDDHDRAGLALDRLQRDHPPVGHQRHSANAV